ncbi:MAG: GNAT family N-acetyltransferase, partial [Acidobacteriota bacterium]|nr:GNAT family N-acetyltransferase [Acidobacteriota bacterium]
MSEVVRVNELGQPVGEALPHWTPPPVPPRTPMEGRYCVVRPLVPADAPGLWKAFSLDREGRNWTYLAQGPYGQDEDFARWVSEASASVDPQFHVVGVPRGPAPLASSADPVGVAAYMRITPASGVIEVGNIHFSPLLQRTRAATEAMYLMMRRVFELGYRRYEWKCDA